MSEFYGNDPSADPDLYSVDGSVARMSYNSASFGTLALGPNEGLFNDGGYALPLDIKFKHRLVDSNSDFHNIVFYMGPHHYTDIDSWISYAATWADNNGGKLEFSFTFSSEGEFEWPVDIDNPDDVFGGEVPATSDEAQEWWFVRVQVDSVGFRAKTWKLGTGEPTWLLTRFWTSPPPRTMFRYLYLETQGSNSPFIGNPQPVLEVDSFSINCR
jgi:hypothetical protein